MDVIIEWRSVRQNIQVATHEVNGRGIDSSMDRGADPVLKAGISQGDASRAKGGGRT
jgi:hypothetical protein